MKKLNLGCGTDYKEGYINLDAVKFPEVDVVFNLNKYPWPFKANTFDEVLAFNILEHLNDSYLALEELNRICKNGAIVKFVVPHFSSSSCWGDVQHKKGFSVRSFSNPNMIDKFRIIKINLDFSWYKFWLKNFANTFTGFYETNLAYIFTSGDIHGMLGVIK